MIAEDFVKALKKAAKEQGIPNIQCYVEKVQETLIKVFEGKPEKTEFSKLERIYMEGEWQGKVGSAYTENLTEERFPELLEIIKQSAECGNKKWLHNSLKDIEHNNPQGLALDVKSITKQLLVAEQAALEFDERVTAVSECWYESRNRSIMLTNGEQTMYEDCGKSGRFGIKVAAGDGNQVETCFRVFLLEKNKDLSALSLQIAKEVVGLLGATTLATGNYPVILENHVVSELLSAYLPAFYEENVDSGMSCLYEKLHINIACEDVTISEEPLMEGTALKRSFDDEGEVTFSKDLIQSGKLNTYLYNKTSAKGEIPAGNGFRMEYKQPVTTGVTNMLFHKGDKSMEELTKKMGDGLMITHIDGAFAGTNVSSGDFSLIAKGFQIKGGKRVGAVHRITIAGDFVTMLQSIQGIGKEYYTLYGGNQTVTSPALLLESLTVSGV